MSQVGGRCVWRVLSWGGRFVRSIVAFVQSVSSWSRGLYVSVFVCKHKSSFFFPFWPPVYTYPMKAQLFENATVLETQRVENDSVIVFEKLHFVTSVHTYPRKMEFSKISTPGSVFKKLRFQKVTFTCGRKAKTENKH